MVKQRIGVAASVKRSGLAYKVGLGVIVTGAAVVGSSWLLGGVVFVAVNGILTILGAPDDRTLLPPYKPEVGGQLLRLFGGILLACGAYIVSIRLAAELLGLAGSSEWITKLGRAQKLGAGAAAIGFIVAMSSGLSQALLIEVLLYNYGKGAVVPILETVGSAGGVLLLGGLAILLLAGSNRHRLLLGWTDRVGWGKLGFGWINKLGLGLIVLAVAGATLGFEDPTTIVAAAGIGILLVGMVPHFLAGGRP